MNWKASQEQLEDWGWSQFWDKLSLDQIDTHQEPARVTSQDRDLWTIQTVSGSKQARVLSSRRNSPRPAIGDWVIVEPGSTKTDPWTIHKLLPRRSQLTRAAAGTGDTEQVIAANIDLIWIVHGLDVPLNPRKIERYLAVAWESGATPEIILTKTDLAESIEVESDELASITAGVDVYRVSSHDLDSIHALKSVLRVGSTICLLGPSGVGKSTLVNALLEEQVTITAEVRSSDRKGRHTTIRRELYRIPGGACLIDTPGIRELRIWSLEEGLNSAFPDIEKIATECRFRDCKHESEPGCAVISAVDAGTLKNERLDSFRKLQAEAAYARRTTDPRARAAAVSEWKSVKKSMKQHPKRGNRK